MRLDDQIRGLVAARHFRLVYPLRRRAIYPQASIVAADDNDVFPLGAEQRRDQEAAPVEGLVYSALRSPPFFRLKQRHFLGQIQEFGIATHDGGCIYLQLLPGLCRTPGLWRVAMTPRCHNI